ncbi:MAG: hypothetical protein ACR2ON_00715 [Paracoccaceae bacterium]
MSFTPLRFTPIALMLSDSRTPMVAKGEWTGQRLSVPKLLSVISNALVTEPNSPK